LRPGRDDLLRYIHSAPGRPARREIARAFGLGPADRSWLNATLRELADEGLIDRRTRGLRPNRKEPRLPSVSVLAVTEVDDSGEIWGEPTRWVAQTPVPRVQIVSSRQGRAPGVGDRILARTRKTSVGFVGSVMRVLEAPPAEVIGVFNLSSGEARIQPVDKKSRAEYRVRGPDSGGAQPGDIVIADVLASSGVGLRQAKVRERVGGLDDPHTLSLIALHQHGIPAVFSEDARREAAAAQVPSLADRTDFRTIPFVTIDPDDARDFDDAIWAQPERDGWFVRVAIADVANYVQPGTALDIEARERGNSVYFPDRVVPMLPEALSSGVCSLLAGKDRACIVSELHLDVEGNVRTSAFRRGLMRSARRFTYAEAQHIHDHGGEEADRQLLDPLFNAYAALSRARNAREPLEIITTDLDVSLGPDGRVTNVHPQPHLEAHRLIEAYMIAANVAAADTMAVSNVPSMYRVHDQPDPEKVEALRQFLHSLGYRLAKGVKLRPHHFNRILRRAVGTRHAEITNQVVLRAQSQASYSPVNTGHFGLALTGYVHFTSPIRRYADLLVHRALITAFKLSGGGFADSDTITFTETARHISMTERRAMAAERDTTARYLSEFLSGHEGSHFAARISGIGRAGVFVTFLDTGADALVPLRTFRDDHYRVNEAHHCIVGEHTARTYRLGDAVEVELLEATAATGGLVAAIIDGGKIDKTAHKRSRSTRHRPPRSL